MRPKIMSCFRKAYRPYFFGAYPKLFLGHLRIFLLFLCFSYVKKKLVQKICSPTYHPTKYWDVSGNKTFIFFFLAWMPTISSLHWQSGYLIIKGWFSYFLQFSTKTYAVGILYKTICCGYSLQKHMPWAFSKKTYAVGILYKTICCGYWLEMNTLKIIMILWRKMKIPTLGKKNKCLVSGNVSICFRSVDKRKNFLYRKSMKNFQNTLKHKHSQMSKKI